MKIASEDLDDLTLGAVFLATGGGGDPYLIKLLTKAVLDKYGAVELLAAKDLDDGAVVVAVGDVGAPTVGLELLPSLGASSDALEAYQEGTGKQIDAVASFEIGGGNSLTPIAAAAKLGMPVIDGDGMGRALPEAQMMTYSIAGVKPIPALAYDYRGEVTWLKHSDPLAYEEEVRAIAMNSGGMITTVEHPMTGLELKQSVVSGTLSFSMKLGALLRKKRGNVMDILEPLQGLFEDSIYGECRMLYRGKVVDKSTRVIGGFDVGHASIQAFDKGSETSQANLELSIKNEYLIAKLDGETLASVPDLVVILDYETSEPINCERLRYGQRIAVLAIGCPQQYRTEKALKVVSPRNFGFEEDYIPLEKRPSRLNMV